MLRTGLGFRKPIRAHTASPVSLSPKTNRLTHSLTRNQVNISIYVLNRKPPQGLLGGDANSTSNSWTCQPHSEFLRGYNPKSTTKLESSCFVRWQTCKWLPSGNRQHQSSYQLWKQPQNICRFRLRPFPSLRWPRDHEPLTCSVAVYTTAVTRHAILKKEDYFPSATCENQRNSSWLLIYLRWYFTFKK